MISIKKRSRGRTEDGLPNPIDIHIGKRIYQRRRLLNMSQEELAKHLRLTFQQIQKYEKGDNRVSGSRLWMISRILQVPIDYFFANMDQKTIREGENLLSSSKFSAPYTSNYDIMQRNDVLELITAYLNSRHKEITELLKTAIIKLSRKIK